VIEHRTDRNKPPKTAGVLKIDGTVSGRRQ